MKKKIWYKWDKNVDSKDETTMIDVYNGRIHALGKYQHVFKNFFNDELRQKTLYTDMISGKKRNERVRWLYYNSMNKFNKLFHSDSSHYQTQFFMQKNNKFHILQSFDKNHKIAVSPYYHESAGNFFKALSICW